VIVITPSKEIQTALHTPTPFTLFNHVTMYAIDQNGDIARKSQFSNNMRIIFSWKLEAERYTPQSHSDTINSDGFCLIDCILMDDGGLPYEDTISWLNEGIKSVESVILGECESSEWIREAWGSIFSNDRAKIYSLYQEDYCQTFSLQVFLEILSEWVIFLESKHDVRETQILTLD